MSGRVPAALAGAPRTGDLASAVAAVPGTPARADFVLRARDPRQDMQYGESLALVLDPSPYRSARLALARARRAWPSCAGAWLASGAVECVLGRPKTALAHLETARRLAPRSGWIMAWLGVTRSLEARRLRTGEGLEAAVADLARAATLGAAASFVSPWRAELLHDLDRHEEALAELARVPAGDPSALWARVERGEILCERGRAQEALRDFDRLVAEHPREPWAWALRGRTLATSGRAEDALPDLSRAVALAPRSAAARAWRSEALRRLGRYREAMQDLDRATALDARFTLAWVWRGRLRLLLGRPAAALRDLDRAVRLDSRYRLGRAWRGEALFKLGRRREAERDFAAVAPLDPRRFWNATVREGVVADAAARARAYLDDLARAEARR